jgi:hypothetical protein
MSITRPDLEAIRSRTTGDTPKITQSQAKQRRKDLDEALYSIPNLIDALQELYPNTLPMKRIDDWRLGILQGRQEVIATIVSWLKEQEENKEL